jgi:hypothetical protein
MLMSPFVRKALLVVHVISSVAWLGAVAAFLILAVEGLRTSAGAGSPYPPMNTVTAFAIVPFCWLSLVSGIVQSLGTTWGLFQHYWVIAKLVITALSTAILQLHTQPIAFLAATAASGAPMEPHRSVQLQMVFDASLAIVALVVATVLAIYKPPGITPYGWRKQREKPVTVGQR